MKILIVDDSPDSRNLIRVFLKQAGYNNVLQAESALDCYCKLNLTEQVEQESVDLILMDIVMADIDGIQALMHIKTFAAYQDVPVLMVTTETAQGQLERAFACGAVDYMTKPLKKIELLARVGSALKLKAETDCRKQRELALLEATEQLACINIQLRSQTELDGLTGIANRRRFDECLNSYCQQMQQAGQPLSLVMLDVDCFKAYNDTYGHYVLLQNPAFFALSFIFFR